MVKQKGKSTNYAVGQKTYIFSITCVDEQKKNTAALLSELCGIAYGQ